MGPHLYNEPAGVPTFVFVHGFLGFEMIGAAMRVIPYFRGIRAVMDRLGIPYIFPTLPAAGTVAERARVLDERLAVISADRLVLIGHSMGGIDARYFAHNFDRGSRVRCVVTLATPHRGTAVAERLLTGNGPAHRLAQHCWRPALHDLTEEACLRRNETLLDVPDVPYISYAAARPRESLPFWLRPFSDWLGDRNDGLVAVPSAEWGEFHGVLNADHFEIVGWSLSLPRKKDQRPFRHIALYESMFSNLRHCHLDKL